MKVNNQPAKSGQENNEVTKKIPLEYNVKLLKLHTKPDFGREELKYNILTTLMAICNKLCTRLNTQSIPNTQAQ